VSPARVIPQYGLDLGKLPKGIQRSLLILYHPTFLTRRTFELPGSVGEGDVFAHLYCSHRRASAGRHLVACYVCSPPGAHVPFRRRFRYPELRPLANIDIFTLLGRTHFGHGLHRILQYLLKDRS
jgi:hypothetical protein